jgi:uncharacterized repeat protein (TIGR01451 family)
MNLFTDRTGFSLLQSIAAIGLTLSAHATYVSLTIIPESCGNSNGAISADVSGPEPFTFLWSNGATTQDLSNIPAGSYSLSVTDGDGIVTVEVATVQNLQGLFYMGGAYFGGEGGVEPIGMPYSGPCPGQCNGRLAMDMVSYGGTPPYEITWSGNSGPIQSGFPIEVFGAYLPTYEGFCYGDTISYTYTDSYGCSGSASPFVVQGPDTAMLVLAVHGACGGGANGSAEFYIPPPAGYGSTTATIYFNGSFLASLGSGYVQRSGLLAGDYELRGTFEPCGTFILPFTIPALGVPCGTVSGTAFLDDDQDCQPDANEIRQPELVLTIQPGPQYALTNGSGNFEFALPNGSYTLEHSSPGLVPLCPLPQPVPFTVASNAAVINLGDSSTAPFDLSLYMAGNVARPGFSSTVHTSVANRSAKLGGPIQVVTIIDPTLIYMSANPAPTSVVGNTITWDFASVSPYQGFATMVSVMVPVATPLGTVLNSSATVTTATTEASLLNNSFAISQVVTGSFDPNDKTARTSSGNSGTHYFLDQDEWIDYTIRFQNTGIDTAFTVVVTDTLGQELDMATFQPILGSHPYTVSFKPGRAVEWRFDNILLPDSNVNEPKSHGLLSFRILPMQATLPGTVIENIANIYFDFNDPVITEPSVLTAEFSTDVRSEHDQQLLRVFPVPATHSLTVLADKAMRSLEVFGADGRSVLQATARSSSAMLDIQPLPVGIYFLRVRTLDDAIQQIRFTKY